MTEKQAKWLTVLVLTGVSMHLVSYNIKYCLPDSLVKYWYWIFNSTAHTFYCISTYYGARLLFKRHKYRELKILLLFLEDWIGLEILDVYNQFRGHYNINPTPQWIIFGVILIIQVIRYKKWKATIH